MTRKSARLDAQAKKGSELREGDYSLFGKFMLVNTFDLYENYMNLQG